ncbi:MAG: outer membrane protein transport protein [Myxococcales bacterium]|nr:outer membrane protein transport protein [Myxococcales bacterium]
MKAKEQSLARLIGTAGGLAALALGSTSAFAGGFNLPGFGPAAQAQAGAFVATADDAMAIYTNPAGLADQSGTTIQIGGSFIDYSLSFTRRGAYDAVDGQTLPWEGDAYETVHNTAQPEVGFGDFQAIPMIAVSTDLGLGIKGLRFGFGFTAPPAYPARDFESDYVIDDPNRPPPPTRYDAVKQDASVVLPSIAVAYEVNDALSVGGRFSWGFGEISSTVYTWALPTANYEEWVGNEARIELSGKDDFVPIVSLGVHYKLSPTWEVAAMWQSITKISAKGSTKPTLSEDLELGGLPIGLDPLPDAETKCAKGGTPDALATCVDFALPMTAEIGARYVMRNSDNSERGSIEADVRWEQWSAASDFTVVVDAQASGIALRESLVRHGFQDVWSARLGGNYRVPVGGNSAILRAGAAYETATAKPGWERVDLDGAAKTIGSAGVGMAFGKVAVELGAMYTYQGKREVGTDCNPTNDEPGCGGSVAEPADRTGPDPIAPLKSADSQFQSPFNAGTYKSSYLMLMLGVATTF